MNLLVIRFKDMGGVVLVAPAVEAITDTYPDVNITVVTQPQNAPFFENMERVSCKVAYTKGRHKGILGLIRLYREIMQQQRPDKVIDLHDVIRSWILCFLFKLSGIPSWRINKERDKMRALTRQKNKIFVKLKHALQKYYEVFEAAGLPISFTENIKGFKSTKKPDDFLEENHLIPKKEVWIGIAPFSAREPKIWPINKMEKVIERLIQKNYKVLLFGGGQKEINRLKDLNMKFPQTISVAGKMKLTDEIGLIKMLDLMITMDSSNMHIASLCNIPVVSIWGPTHPYGGYSPLNGNEKYVVQIPHEQLPCRPNSIGGRKPCCREDFACMEWITPKMVLDMVEKALAENTSLAKS